MVYGPNISKLFENDFFFFHFHLLIGISEETNGTSVAKYFASYGWLDLTLYERGMEIVCLGS